MNRKTTITLEENVVKIDNEISLLCITKNDVKKYMVVAIENKEILPYNVTNIMAHIRSDEIYEDETSNNYLVKTR